MDYLLVDEGRYTRDNMGISRILRDWSAGYLSISESPSCVNTYAGRIHTIQEVNAPVFFVECNYDMLTITIPSKV